MNATTRHREQSRIYATDVSACGASITTRARDTVLAVDPTTGSGGGVTVDDRGRPGDWTHATIPLH